MWKKLMFALALTCMGNAWAGANDPIVSKVWVGESVPGQTTATLQMNLTTIKPVNLLSVSSPFAEAIKIHSLMKYKGAMKVLIVDSLPLPDRRTITFGTHGLFLMMTGLKQPLKIGDRVPLSLVIRFNDKQTKTISAEAEVRKMELSYKHYGPNEVYDNQK